MADNDTRRTDSNQDDEQSQQDWRPEDESSLEETRERSNREPASTANDRGMYSDTLESEEGIEVDLDSEFDVDEDVEGGSSR